MLSLVGKIINKICRIILNPIGNAFLGELDFLAFQQLSVIKRLILYFQFARLGVCCKRNQNVAHLIFFVYSEAGKRMLLPIIRKILNEYGIVITRGQIDLTLVMFQPINKSVLSELLRKGCKIDETGISLILAAKCPLNKVFITCLDHRYYYQHHRYGVNAVDILRKNGVKTFSIQHGSTRDDSLLGLSTSASEVMMVWGRYAYTKLIKDYQIDKNRLRLVGNPLHDNFFNRDKNEIRRKISELFPDFPDRAQGKKICLWAACSHNEYRSYANEKKLYRKYAKCIYDNCDPEKIVLIVKMHPQDGKNSKIYFECLPSSLTKRESIYLISSSCTFLSIYDLIQISDVIVTRASTAAEDALVIGKKVIAFDLFENGPASRLKHLKEYSEFEMLIDKTGESLRPLIAKLSQECLVSKNLMKAQEDLTFQFDGNSTKRCVDAIFRGVNIL